MLYGVYCNKRGWELVEQCDIKKLPALNKENNCGNKFKTMNINLAYQFKDYLEIFYKNNLYAKSYVWEVKEYSEQQ